MSLNRWTTSFLKTAVQKVTLNSGYDMPIFGLGTWKSKPGEVRAAVECAIDAGYRHIDCAAVYQNEFEVCEGINNKLKKGKVERGNLFITSKLWNIHHDPKDVKTALEASLNKLGLDYLDLYLVHWPMGYVNNGNMYPKDRHGTFLVTDTDYVTTWKAMERVHKEGLAKSIGLSNFNEFQIKRILKEGTVVPANHQFESHPYLVQEDLVKLCLTNGISVTAHSPLGSADRPWVKKGEPVLLEDTKLKKIANRLNKTPAQILLRYQIQRGIIVIPKSVTPSRIKRNFEIFDFELSEDDTSIMNSFNHKFRGCGLEWVQHKYHPFQENYCE